MAISPPSLKWNQIQNIAWLKVSVPEPVLSLPKHVGWAIKKGEV
jgi:hypothetical protein